MKGFFNKKNLVLAMFVLLFITTFVGCDERQDYDTGYIEVYMGRENVVVENDNEVVVNRENEYLKPRYLRVKDLKDGVIRRVEYFSDFYSFAQPGDTITLYVPRFKKLYKATHYKPGESNLREAVKVEGVFYTEWIGQTYIMDTYDMIESHQADYYVQQQRIKEELDNMSYKLNRAIDSLLIEFANMSEANRRYAEKIILHSDNKILKEALSIIKAAERDKHVADSMRVVMENMERERLLEQQRREREAERQKNRTIIQHKRNGTLWQYIDSLNVAIKDTVTIVRVYKEKQLKGGLEGSYNSKSYTQPIEGVGPRGFWRFGSGRGHISGGGGQSIANGNLNGYIDYSSHGAVVARDKYGYEYVFPADPMMQFKAGDKVFLEYYGRVHNDNGYMDRIKVLSVKTR